MGHTASQQSRTRFALACAVLAFGAAAAAVAIFGGSRAQAADHLEAPLFFRNVDLVSAELGPLGDSSAQGIVHLKQAPAGRMNSLAINVSGLTPDGSYEIALTRGTCGNLGDVHGFFDLGAELAYKADPSGVIAVQDPSIRLKRRKPQGTARTLIVRRAADDSAVACGRLKALEQVKPRRRG